MSNIETIFKAIEFIEHHLKEEITINDVANAVYFSLFHFCRTFNKIVHHPPYDYLMRRRLSESARELVETDKKIIEIAFDYQFNSPETYSRAFKRMFGAQPNQWKKLGKIPEHRLMPRLTLAHLQHLHQGEYLKPVFVEKTSFQLIGLMTLVKNDLATVSELWEMLFEEITDIKDMIKNFYGVTWYPPNCKKCDYFYMAGFELQSVNKEFPRLVTKKIPFTQWVRFVHKGDYGKLQLSRDYIYHTWFPRSGKNLFVALEIECFQNENSYFHKTAEEFEIFIPVK